LKLPDNFAGFFLYRIYYGDLLVYVGRTMQPLQDRIRGHLFKKPLHREIAIQHVTKIEYAQFETMADMYLFEIYFINLWKPPLNKDDKAGDRLTVSLPDVEWKEFHTPLWEKWKRKIEEIDAEEENRRKMQSDTFQEKREMRKKLRTGEITEEEYWTYLTGSAEGQR
jgi:hypothetical protein